MKIKNKLFDPSRPDEIYHDKLWDLWSAPLLLLLFLAFTLLGSLTWETDEGRSGLRPSRL